MKEKLHFDRVRKKKTAKQQLCPRHRRNNEPPPRKIGNIARFKRARRELITAALLTTDKNCFRFGDYTVKIRNTRPPRYDLSSPPPSEIHFQIKPGTKASSRCSHPARVTCIDAKKQENPKNKLASWNEPRAQR